ncbi:MAG: TonB-dependent receptor [Candidatus Delongbacteria bacterium]
MGGWKNRVGGLSLLLLGTLPGWSQDVGFDRPVELEELVVTATRTPLRLEQVASAVTVLGRSEIEQSGAADLAALLEQLPFLDISRAGGPGGTATLRLRGLNDSHTLLLVDGVELNDPISPGRSVDLGTLPLESIERVEVLRGPQSALYGADAVGGVVQIFTRRGRPGAWASLSGGSHGRTGSSAGFSRLLGPLELNLDLGRESLTGFSAARPAPEAGDADGLRSSHGRLGLAWQARPGLRLNADLSGERSRAELDNFGGPGGDDPDYHARTERAGGRLGAELTQAGGQSVATVWEQATRREYRNRPDAAHPGESEDSEYRGRITHAGLQHVRGLPGGHQLLVAAEWEREAGDYRYASASSFGPWLEQLSERSQHQLSFVLQDQWTRGPLLLTGSLRRDQPAQESARLTGRMTAGVAPQPGWWLRGSYGSGFKAPSLYQRHSPSGNLELAPEHAHGWDLGLDWHAAALQASFSWFRTQLQDQIDYDAASWRYVNLGRTTAAGLEADGRGPLPGGLEWSARWTWQHSVDARTGRDLLRRPRQLGRLGLSGSWGAARLGAAWRHEGARRDLDFSAWPAQPVELAAFSCVDLRAAWEPVPRWQAWLSVQNVLAADSQEIWGYNGQPRAWRLGLDWNL